MKFTAHERAKIWPQEKEEMKVIRSRYGKDKFRLHVKPDGKDEWLGTFSLDEIDMAQEEAVRLIKKHPLGAKLRNTLKSCVAKKMGEIMVQ